MRRVRKQIDDTHSHTSWGPYTGIGKWTARFQCACALKHAPPLVCVCKCWCENLLFPPHQLLVCCVFYWKWMNIHAHESTHARTHTPKRPYNIPHRWQLLSFSIPFDDLIYAKLYTSDVVEFDLNSSTIISHSENVHSLRSSIRNALATDSSFHRIIFLFPLKLLSPPC